MLPVGFRCTWKVVLSVCDPAGLWPVIVKVWSPWGSLLLGTVTLTLESVTLPIPLLIDWLVVQVLLQSRVPLSPTVMSAGLAEMLTDGQTGMYPALGSR